MIVKEHILDSLECAKHLTSNQIVNSSLIKSIFDQKKKNPQYFDRIEMKTLASAYLKTYQNILNDATNEGKSKSLWITGDI